LLVESLVRFQPLLRILIAICLFTAFAGRGEAAGEIPFQFQDGYLWVDVQAAGGQQPLHFLLDSGAASSVLSTDAARRLGIKRGFPVAVQGVGSQATAYRVNRFRAQAGGIPLPTSLLTLDLRAVSATCHQPIDGLLGADFFRARIVQIDFRAGKIRLLERVPQGGDLVTLPIKIRNDAFCVPVAVAGNSARSMRIDTGCDSSLEWVAGDAGPRAPAGTAIGLANGNARSIPADIRLGGIALQGVKTGLHPRAFFPGEFGLVGNGLLSRFRVTIDAPGRRLVLERL
jgi:hypothetical protein